MKSPGFQRLLREGWWRQMLFDAFPRAGAEVGGDGQPEIGRQQIIGHEPQPAEVVAFGARLVKQQMRAGRHGAD